MKWLSQLKKRSFRRSSLRMASNPFHLGTRSRGGMFVSRCATASRMLRTSLAFQTAAANLSVYLSSSSE